jgi:hypothetical protein
MEPTPYNISNGNVTEGFPLNIPTFGGEDGEGVGFE